MWLDRPIARSVSPTDEVQGHSVQDVVQLFVAQDVVQLLVVQDVVQRWLKPDIVQRIFGTSFESSAVVIIPVSAEAAWAAGKSGRGVGASYDVAAGPNGSGILRGAVGRPREDSFKQGLS